MIRPSALGDVCRSVPLLVSLRRAFPRAEIDWLVQQEFAPAIAAHPDLSQVIAFPRRHFSRWWGNAALAGDLFKWLHALGRPPYDLAIDAQGLARSAIMARATRAPQRIGLRRARELGWLAYTDRVSTEANLHTVDEMLALLRPVEIEAVRDLTLHLSAVEQQWHASWRAENLALSGRYAVLAPTARWKSKRWPIEHWAELIDPLVARGFTRIVIIGAPGEEEQVNALFAQPRPEILDMVGRATISQTMAIIAGASLLIANDSAPLHMGQGFGIPSLGLFGPTDPAIVGPYRQPHAALRAFVPKPGCRVHFKDDRLGDSLMRLIPVEDVIARVDELLATRAATEARTARANAE